MREYGQIQSAFWQSADAEAMSDKGKLLACYLLTGPYANGLGCFRLTDGNIMDDLGWSSETVSETVSELSRIGFAYRIGRVVFLPNFLRWNRIANPKVAIARLKELETLPTPQAKSLAARALLSFCPHLTEAQRKELETVSQTVCETLSKQNPTQPNPIPTTSGGEPPVDPDPIFGTGLAFLTRKGVAERPARSFLGKLRKDVGDLRCVELLSKAESEDVSEPLAWLRAAAEKRGKPAAGQELPDFIARAI
jgi:hypothetical protein